MDFSRYRQKINAQKRELQEGTSSVPLSGVTSGGSSFDSRVNNKLKQAKENPPAAGAAVATNNEEPLVGALQSPLSTFGNGATTGQRYPIPLSMPQMPSMAGNLIGKKEGVASVVPTASSVPDRNPMNIAEYQGLRKDLQETANQSYSGKGNDFKNMSWQDRNASSNDPARAQAIRAERALYKIDNDMSGKAAQGMIAADTQRAQNAGAWDRASIEQAGALQRTGMQEQGNTARAGMREVGETNRLGMSNKGAMDRVKLSESGQTGRAKMGIDADKNIQDMRDKGAMDRLKLEESGRTKRDILKGFTTDSIQSAYDLGDNGEPNISNLERLPEQPDKIERVVTKEPLLDEKGEPKGVDVPVIAERDPKTGAWVKRPIVDVGKRPQYPEDFAGLNPDQQAYWEEVLRQEEQGE
jgi:hypothetical protein